MNVTIIHVGQLKEKFFIAAAEEYQKRLGKFCTLKNVYIKEAHVNDKAFSEADFALAIEDEGKRILRVLPPAAKSINIALCIEGELYSTEKLCSVIDSARFSAKDLCFVIGGSRGLSEQVKKACQIRLSMSPMTFPHRLARVMLLEQLYRCSSILMGGKYHK